MDAGQEFFARVRPLLGQGLEGKHVTVDHPDLALPLLEMLHACMLDGISTTSEHSAWRAHLAGKNPWRPIRSPAIPPDARVRVSVGNAGRMDVDAANHEIRLMVPADDDFTAMDVFTHAAWLLKDVLTGKAPWLDLSITVGDHRWPFSTTGVAHGVPVEPGRGLHIMVVGCGSLGSEAVRLLQPYASEWTLVDAGKVTVFNLNRQWFFAGDIGQPKVHALQRQLAAPVHVHPHALETAQELELLLQGVDVVLLATGTHHHAALAEVLWRRKVPHVAACCYPQARFFETVVVDPSRATPCFECLRGHLFRGAAAPAPMTDDVAAFVYSAPDDAARQSRYVDLVAEPATRMDTFRAASVAARAVTALMATSAPLWLTRAMEEGTTCLLGGNTPVRTEDGGWAYGISRRGQVLRLGLPDLAGSVERETCACCGRDVRMVHVEEVASTPAAEQDQAMMEAMLG